MNNQLSNISTQYRKFSKGQYIEHTQFNEFLDFFEDQDRLSRVMLQGVGVVCGLKPQLIYANKVLNNIQLSQGVAITTDGDLLTLGNTSKVSGDLYVSDLKTINIENKQYTHFKVYDDYKVKYPAFHDGGEQIDLWELATSSEAKAGFQPIASLTNLEDKYLLLYLETYEKEVKPCRGVDCDNHGIQQIRNLKVLVTTKDGVDQIFAKDKIYPHPTLSGLGIDRKVKRVILEPKATSVDNLIQAYKKVTINESNYGFMFRDIEFISTMINVPTVGREIFIERLNNLSSQDRGFQYAYDIIKDLFDTYTELIRLLPKSFTKCLPDLLSFPKHIMLGKLVSNTKLDYTRHQFYNSPILDSEKTTQRVELLLERFNQQILQFKNPLEAGNEVKITPSQELRPLGEEAIPFYYNLTEDFLKAWNFDKTSNRVSDVNLSFDTALLSEDLHIQKPIAFNIDKKSFYRIEGHQGMNYETAVESIKDIKDEYQLGFDIMALSLEELVGNKDLSKAYFTEYVEKHPGLEHRGGVGRGGTFAVVYASQNDKTVIADFSLPYLCCTPKSDVRLSLPSTAICKDAKPVLFTVTPPNGVVKANVAQELNGGVENINGQYVFNPEKVSTSLHNQEITFTVNGKPTNCVIKVLPKPDMRVSVDSIAYPEGGSNTTTVTFVVSGANFDAYDYSWDFLGNGNYVALKPNAQRKVTYTYYNLDVKRTPVIKVQISSNGCSQNTTIANWYVPQGSGKPPVATATADRTAIYLPDNAVKLTGSAVPGEGSIVSYLWTNQDGVTITNPNDATTGAIFTSPGTYTFTLTVKNSVNLTDTDFITITVGTKASVTGVSISPASPDTRSTIIATASISNPDNIGGLEYNWNLDDEDIGTTTTTANSISLGMLTSGAHTITVGLGNSTGYNHVTTPKSTSFIVKSVNPPVATATADRTAIYLPDNAVKLTGSAVPGEGSIVSYLWTNQDGVTITNPNDATTGAIFTSPGTYTFTLTVKNSVNLTDTDFITITVGTKASVTGVSISPASPDTRSTIIATASISNPSNIQNLKYEWYLDGEFQEETSLDTRSFGALTVGDKTIEVGLVSSAGNNHVTDKKSVSFAVKSAPSTGGSSFLAGTSIRMSDGSLKKVEEIKQGDRLRGSQGTVNVLDVVTYESDSRLYRLNNAGYFITAAHPVMTEGGWKSFDPNTTKIIVPSITVGQLVKGDILFKEDGKRVTLDNTDFREGVNLVYNFSVDGTKDFYANEYLVHNKAEIAEPR